VQNEIGTLLNEFSIARDDFQIAGVEYPFSTIHPDTNTVLKIRITDTKFGSVIFGLLILYGIMTIKIPIVRWIQISLALIIFCVFAGFILTTLTEYLATLSAVYLGIGIIIICRMVSYLFTSCKKNRVITEQVETPDSVSVSNNNIVTNNQEGEQNNEN
jgi:Ca2+/Na+ antiporter